MTVNRSLGRSIALGMLGLVVGGLSACDVRKPVPHANADKDSATESKPVTRDPNADAPSASSDQVIVLTDVTAESQIDFVHHYDGGGEMYIVEPVASGMASFDFDLDGWIDLYFLNGAPVPPAEGVALPNALVRNLGGMRFADVSAAAQVDDRSFSTGVAVADFDADGFPDFFVNNYGRNKLYHNNGDGTFSDVTAVAQVAGGPQLGAGVCFLDVDQDGLLDLYVGNYVKSPVETNVKRTTDGFPSYPGPLDFDPDTDWLYRNEGDGRFKDISQESGIASVATTSMGAIAGDFDADGDSDLVVVNDVDRNLFFQNNGLGEFEEIGIQAGIAYSHDAQRNGNMGIDCADYNHDGALDFYTTTFSNDAPVLYRNDGYGNFQDVTLASGAGASLIPHANWGLAFFDAENDGDQDLIIANGHTDPNVQKWAYNTAWKVANTLLVNDGRGHFADQSNRGGSGLLPVESSRGLVVEDLDNDGDLDVAILNALAAPTIIRNDSAATSNHWLQVDLRGRSAPRDGTGTRVTVVTDGIRRVAEVHSGRGYQSSFGQRLSFGLGGAAHIDELIIRWPLGAEQTLKNVTPNQRLTVIQP